MTTESHPLEPFLPPHATLLFLGSFPPPKARWSMDFFYPNYINDFWRIMGVLFADNKTHFEIHEEKRFHQQRIMDFAKQKGLAFYDTATKVHRLKGNASDKFLEIVCPTDIARLASHLPLLKALITTGEKATETLCAQLHLNTLPAVGQHTQVPSLGIELYRLPSSSRAYPLSLEKKVRAYHAMFQRYGIDMYLQP